MFMKTVECSWTINQSKTIEIDSIKKMTIRWFGPISLHIQLERPFCFPHYENTFFYSQSDLNPYKSVEVKSLKSNASKESDDFQTVKIRAHTPLQNQDEWSLSDAWLGKHKSKIYFFI